MTWSNKDDHAKYQKAGYYLASNRRISINEKTRRLRDFREYLFQLMFNSLIVCGIGLIVSIFSFTIAYLGYYVYTYLM